MTSLDTKTNTTQGVNSKREHTTREAKSSSTFFSAAFRLMKSIFGFIFGVMIIIGAFSYLARGIGFVASKLTDDELTESTPLCSAATNQGPELVLLPGGVFQMGAHDDYGQYSQDETPLHKVTVQPFAISACEITVAQFQQFVDESQYITTSELAVRKPDTTYLKCVTIHEDSLTKGASTTASWRDPNYTQNAHMPAVCISWVDAKNYTDWLSKKTGIAYRLPSSAEWEYAARAGTEQMYYFRESEKEKEKENENNSVCEHANIGDIASRDFPTWTKKREPEACSDGYAFSAPVASYTPNNFGLYDMAGNVWEWVEDCHHKNYHNAPYDGSPWLLSKKSDGNCKKRSLRGGSWRSTMQDIRSSNLTNKHFYYASSSVGFRVARSLSNDSENTLENFVSSSENAIDIQAYTDEYDAFTDEPLQQTYPAAPDIQYQELPAEETAAEEAAAEY